MSVELKKDATIAKKLACAMAGLADIARFCKKYGTDARWYPHEGPNRAQRRAMKYGQPPRKHTLLTEQKIAMS